MNLPQNKSAQAAAHIKASILSGNYSSYLPSERHLAEKLLISRNCVREALQILTREGVLKAPSGSRRRQILLNPATPQPNTPRRCIVITPTPEHQSTDYFLGQLARLRHLLSTAHITVDVQSPEAFRHSSVETSLKSVTASNPNVIWLLHQCPLPIQQWFQDQQLPTIIFGSRFPEISLPAVDCDHQATARHATSMLLRQGHRHVGIVLPQTTLAGSYSAECGFNEALDASPHSVTRTILRHDANVPDLTHALDQTFRRDNRPTALIVHNNHHFLTVFTHLPAIGVRIPHDVSLVSMAYSSSYERLSPRPAFYSTGTQLMRKLASAIANANQGPREYPPLIPEYTAGESVRSYSR